MSVKPILFNTDMVKAILDGRKTVTRRIIKPKYSNTHIEWKTDKYGRRLIELQNDVEGETHGRREDGTTWHKLLAYRELKPLYHTGDILYVRETWAKLPGASSKGGYAYKYKASQEGEYWSKVNGFRWHPSIHMPKEAARIFLKVTDVRIERLQDIHKDKPGPNNQIVREGFLYGCDFIAGWNETVSKKDLDKYGWEANPWVWVIEFERCEKPEESEET